MPKCLDRGGFKVPMHGIMVMDALHEPWAWRTLMFRVYLLPACASIHASMQPVLTYLQENEHRFVRELCDYLRFPSVSAQSHHRADVEAAARWLVEHCQSIGLQSRLCPTEGNPVVIAQTPRNQSATPRRRRHFVVYGHYDVQP